MAEDTLMVKELPPAVAALVAAGRPKLEERERARRDWLREAEAQVRAAAAHRLRAEPGFTHEILDFVTVADLDPLSAAGEVRINLPGCVTVTARAKFWAAGQGWRVERGFRVMALQPEPVTFPTLAEAAAQARRTFLACGEGLRPDGGVMSQFELAEQAADDARFANEAAGGPSPAWDGPIPAFS